MFEPDEDEPPLTPAEYAELRRVRYRGKEALYAIAAGALLLIGVLGNPGGTPDARRTLCYIAAGLLVVAAAYRLRRELLPAH